MHVRFGAVFFALLVLPLAAAGGPAEPLAPAIMVPENGPTPVTATPAEIVTVYEDERFSYTGGARLRSLPVPDGDWSRIVLVFTVNPAGDPWDRLFGVALGDVEVLRGTTPRVPMTIRQDVTRYASLMPPGTDVDTRTLLSSWVGALEATLRFEFYGQDEATAVTVEPAFDSALGAFRWAGHCANGAQRTRALTFPADAPSSAVVELYTSGHGGQLFIPPPGPPGSHSEEFWYGHSPTPRVFKVAIDGVVVAETAAMPYVYALAGFNSQGGGSTNTAVWWTAQRGLNLAGVHTGNGEIPAYRATLPPDVLPLLTGARTVSMWAENGVCTWTTSVSFLLEA